MAALSKQAERFGAEFVTDVATVLELTGPIKTVAVGATPYRAKAVILAMGSDIGRSGWTARSSSLGTASHGARPATDSSSAVSTSPWSAADSALEEAMFLTRFAESVTVLHRRDTLRTAAPDGVQTWTVPGVSHVDGLATAPAQWTTRVIGFLDQALGRTR